MQPTHAGRAIPQNLINGQEINLDSVDKPILSCMNHKLEASGGLQAYPSLHKVQFSQYAI